MEQRYRLADHLTDNPSLAAKLPEAVGNAYRLALVEAERETDLPPGTFPPVCPWGFDQITAEDFWPVEADDSSG